MKKSPPNPIYWFILHNYGEQIPSQAPIHINHKNLIEFFLPVTIVIIPDVLVTNLITKVY